MKMKIGNKLLWEREDRKINQTEMALLLGMSQSAYSRMERNEVAVELDEVVQFAKKLQVPIQEFLPETFAIHHTNNQNGQVGFIIGNFYNYIDKELLQENATLKEQVKTLESKAGDLGSYEDKFWQIAEFSSIDYAKAVTALAQQSLSFLLAFEEHLAQKLYALDRQEFAKSIYGEQPISKDDFLYVRCFTVAQGKRFYQAVAEKRCAMPVKTFESLLYLSEKAYFQKTGAELPALPTTVSYETGSNQQYWL